MLGDPPTPPEQAIMNIVFTDDDLARVRLSSSLDPVSEVMAAGHLGGVKGRGRHAAGSGGPMKRSVLALPR